MPFRPEACDFRERDCRYFSLFFSLLAFFCRLRILTSTQVAPDRQWRHLRLFSFRKFSSNFLFKEKSIRRHNIPAFRIPIRTEALSSADESTLMCEASLPWQPSAALRPSWPESTGINSLICHSFQSGRQWPQLWLRPDPESATRNELFDWNFDGNVSIGAVHQMTIGREFQHFRCVKDPAGASRHSCKCHDPDVVSKSPANRWSRMWSIGTAHPHPSSCGCCGSIARRCQSKWAGSSN